MKPKILERTEYVIKAKVARGGKKGEIMFVPHSHESDVTRAIQHYNNEKHSLTTRSKNLKITIEKHTIRTEIKNFTKDAEKMLKNESNFSDYENYH